jgi:transposase
VTEQRYKAVLAVIGDGRTVSEVATDWGVSRRTMHRWLVRYEGDGLEGLNDRSHRPAQSPHQMPPAVEAMVLEMRRSHPYWGARRIAFELVRKRVERAPSESAVYRCLVRAAVIDPVSRQRRRETWKRWERGAPMELWQLDVVHGFLLADGTSAKALTGVDDHSSDSRHLTASFDSFVGLQDVYVGSTRIQPMDCSHWRRLAPITARRPPSMGCKRSADHPARCRGDERAWLPRAARLTRSALGRRPASTRALRNRNSICALLLRNSSCAQRLIAS